MQKIMVEIYFDMEVFDMGIYIYLDIVPERITQEQWKEVYNKSLKILDEFPFMDIVKKEKNGKYYRCSTRTKSKEICLKEGYTYHRWHSVGDMYTGCNTESFSMTDDIRRYQYEDTIEDTNTDILLKRLVDIDEGMGENVEVQRAETLYTSMVFGNKTQGELSHIPLLGIACMVVSMLPEGTADVFGDINLAQCKKAVQWVSDVLGQEIELPVECCRERLLERLKKSGLYGVDLVKGLLYLTLEDKNIEFGEFLVKNIATETYEYYRERFLDTYEFRSCLHDYLYMQLSFTNLCKMLVTDPKGKQMTPKEFLHKIFESKLHIKEKETYDFTRFDYQNPNKEEVDKMDMVMARTFARMLGGGNHTVNAYIPLDTIIENCEEVFGMDCDVKMLVETILKEQSENVDSDKYKLQSILYDDKSGIMSAVAEDMLEEQKEKEKYDVYSMDDLDKWSKNCTVNPKLEEHLLSLCKQIYDVSVKKVSEFKLLNRREREDFILNYAETYILLTDKVWDEIWDNVMDDIYMERIVSLLVLDVNKGNAGSLCKIMFESPKAFEYYWNKANNVKGD